MLEIWLGGLDSNQDSQIQSLESYQLDDLPTEEEKRIAARPALPAATTLPSNLIGNHRGVNRLDQMELERFIVYP